MSTTTGRERESTITPSIFHFFNKLEESLWMWNIEFLLHTIIKTNALYSLGKKKSQLLVCVKRKCENALYLSFPQQAVWMPSAESAEPNCDQFQFLQSKSSSSTYSDLYGCARLTFCRCSVLTILQLVWVSINCSAVNNCSMVSCSSCSVWTGVSCNSVEQTLALFWLVGSATTVYFSNVSYSFYRLGCHVRKKAK